MNRWSLFVDIEGFSKIYPEHMSQALRPLCDMMEGIYSIGSAVCPDTPHRLFAHQLGDGFIIVSEFAERSPELPIAIGVFLLRHILVSGGMGKCTISQGDYSDIKGCFPEVIRSNMDQSGEVRIGSGLMRLFPVMGSALINCNRLSKIESGSLLLLDSDMPERFPAGVVVSKAASTHYVVDWVHSTTQEINEITAKTGIVHPKANEIERLIRVYISRNSDGLPPNWIQNTMDLNGCS